MGRVSAGHSHSSAHYGNKDAVRAVIANLGVSEYKLRVGRGIGSESLAADGVHSRIDALVSAAAFVGIGLAGAGLAIADPIAGIVITLAIVFVLAGTVKQLFYRMMDPVDPTIVDEIAHAAAAVNRGLQLDDVAVALCGR